MKHLPEVKSNSKQIFNINYVDVVIVAFTFIHTISLQAESGHGPLWQGVAQGCPQDSRGLIHF